VEVGFLGGEATLETPAVVEMPCGAAVTAIGRGVLRLGLCFTS